MNPQSSLDPNVVRMAKAIRQAESGNREVLPQEGATVGGASRYQYTHDTWKEVAGRYLGDANSPLNLQNENKATYLRIKDWKDGGKTPSQIASMWNAGEGRPNAYRENWRGVNAQGIKYDTPEYVQKVRGFYEQDRGSAPQMNNAPPGIGPVNVPQAGGAAPQAAAPAAAAPAAIPEPEEKKPISNRIVDALGFGKTADTIGSLIARSPLANLLQNDGQKNISVQTGKSQEQMNREQVAAPTTKEVLGAGLNVGSLFLGGAGTAAAGSKLAAGKLLPALGASFKASAVAGGAIGLGGALEENKNFADSAKDTAIGVGLGGASGVLIPLAGAASKLVPATMRAGKSATSKIVGAAEDMVAKEARIKSLSKAGQNLVRSGMPEDTIAFVSNASPKTQLSFSKMLSDHKRGLSDRTYVQTQMVKQEPAQTLLRYAEGIQAGSNRAAANLKAIAGTNPNERVDFSSAFQVYVDKLAKRGITVDPRTGNFVSSGKVPSSEMKYYNDIYREIQEVAQNNPQLSRQKAHELRQRLYATLDSATRQGGKPGQRPFSDAVDADVQALRRSLAEQLGPEYQKAAAEYAQNEQVLSKLSKFAGVPINQISTKDRAVGEVLMRALGNASDRPQSLINDVVAAAQRNGVVTDVNINSQIDFADLLEKLYGSTQSRTLAAQVRQGTREAGEDLGGTAFNVASGNFGGAIMQGGRTLLGKGEQDQIRAFEAFIADINKNKGLIQ